MPKKDRGIITSCYFPAWVLEKLERIAHARRVSRNTVLRELVQSALKAKQPRSGRQATVREEDQGKFDS